MLCVRGCMHGCMHAGAGPAASSRMLPIGQQSQANPMRVKNEPVNAELMQALLAVSHAEKPEDIPNANVAGFVLVRDVDNAGGTCQLLAPCEGRMPGRYLIAGSLRTVLQE